MISITCVFQLSCTFRCDIYLNFVNENLISGFQISKITFINENSGFGSFNITTEKSNVPYST